MILSTLILCIGYMIIGPSLILLNKYILYELNFHYPMFLSGLGVLFSGIAAHILVRTGYVKLQRKEAVEGMFWYTRVLPVGMAYAGTLAFGNTAYLLLDVGFIQMLKSFVPVIIMITSYIFGIEYPTRPVILSVIIISIGTAATCSYTPQLSVLGLIVIFTAEFFESIRLVLTQFLLQNLKFGVVEGQYVLSPASAFWLFLASAYFESRKMYEEDAFSIIKENPLAFLAASSLGLGINFLTYYVIQATSSLTMKILGGVRNIGTIFVGVFRYGEVVDHREALGYMVAFIGFISYSAAKSGYFDAYNGGIKSTSLKSNLSTQGTSGLFATSSQHDNNSNTHNGMNDVCDMNNMESCNNGNGGTGHGSCSGGSGQGLHSLQEDLVHSGDEQDLEAYSPRSISPPKLMSSLFGMSLKPSPKKV